MCDLKIFLFSLAGFVPYVIVSLFEILGIVVPEWSSSVSQVLHLTFSFISPLYIPFGANLSIQKIYFKCSLGNPLSGCDREKLRFR